MNSTTPKTNTQKLNSSQTKDVKTATNIVSKHSDIQVKAFQYSNFLKYKNVNIPCLDKTSNHLISFLISFSMKFYDDLLVDEEKVWTYMTQIRFAKFLKLSRTTVITKIKILLQKGILAEKYFTDKTGVAAKYYCINFEIISELLNEQEKTKKELKNLIAIEAEKSADCTLDCTSTIYNNNINKSNKSNQCFDNLQFNPPSSNQTTAEDVQQNIGDNKLQTKHENIVREAFKCASEIGFVDNLNKKLAKKIAAAIKIKFNQNLERFKQFLLDLTKTWLFKSGKSVFLDWVLKFENIDKFFRGWLNFKSTFYEPEIIENEEVVEAEMISYVENIDEPPACIEIRKKLIKQFGGKCYKSWFKDFKIYEKSGDFAFVAPNNFYRDYVLHKFIQQSDFEHISVISDNQLSQWCEKFQVDEKQHFLQQKNFSQKDVKEILFDVKDLIRKIG